jgi:hypothetical protein
MAEGKNALNLAAEVRALSGVEVRPQPLFQHLLTWSLS